MSANIEENRGFFGIIIPAEVLDSEELSVAEKFVYGFIASFTKACFMSNDAISSRLGVSEATVSRAINKLQKAGYVYVEFYRNNSAARRIYSVFDNPKKLKYLASKGLFNREESKSFPQVRQIDEGVSQNDDRVRQIDEPRNRGEASQIDDHRYRINNRRKHEACAKAVEAPSARPRRADFASKEEWEQALYNFSAPVPTS